jgi:hypothetical protein
LRWRDEPPERPPATAGGCRYVSPYLTAGGESMLHVYDAGDTQLLHFPGVADFRVGSDEILCSILDPTREYLARIYLLGTVLAFWLERRGIPALHASAVVTPAGVIGFLSDTGSGKSALAMTFLRAGYPLLTDDILPIQFRDGRYLGHPGYPLIRLWPDQADHFLGAHQELERVDPEGDKRRVSVVEQGVGQFSGRAEPLARLYFPERRNAGIGGAAVEIGRMAPSSAVVELLRNLFAVRIVHAMGWHVDRLRFFSSLVTAVPVRRLSYPTGFERLPVVRDAVLADLS